MSEGTVDGSLPGEANNYDIDDSDRSRPINLNAFITRLFLHPKLGPVSPWKHVFLHQRIPEVGNFSWADNFLLVFWPETTL
jgi:hypothetical protein